MKTVYRQYYKTKSLVLPKSLQELSNQKYIRVTSQSLYYLPYE